jgi:hypothetical protein
VKSLSRMAALQKPSPARCCILHLYLHQVRYLLHSSLLGAYHVSPSLLLSWSTRPLNGFSDPWFSLKFIIDVLLSYISS